MGITRDFGDKVKTRVLFGVDLEIRRGEFTSLIGASGSGKSTLLNIIGALDRPTEGKVIIDGTDLGTLDDDGLALFRNQTMGFIFQSHFLLPQFTVLENVMIPYLIYAGRATPTVKKRALDLLERVGLSHRRDYRANAISGGEQQRAAIARALINQPRMILADEPTGNLDTSNTENVFAMLREINQEFKTSFIMVTHDRVLAERTDRLLIMRDGQIVEDICHI
ncbi:MAG TPA: ABC transporter ATP-binding protein [Syntrophomonas sp.]|nr:ABC transporter ATP-binding protein [Syntrophomonas sp.]